MNNILKKQGFQFETGGGGCQLLTRYIDGGGFVWATCLDGGGLPDTTSWHIVAYGEDIDDILCSIRSDDNDSGLTFTQAVAIALDVANCFESADATCRNGKPMADCDCC
jgi:hypothetical protein